MVRRESFIMKQTSNSNNIVGKENNNLKKRLFHYIVETIKEFAPAVIVMNGSYYRPHVK